MLGKNEEGHWNKLV